MNHSVPGQSGTYPTTLFLPAWPGGNRALPNELRYGRNRPNVESGITDGSGVPLIGSQKEEPNQLFSTNTMTGSKTP
jgi:hypothetical protein